MTRRGFIKGLLGVILAGLFAATYGFFIEPALRFRIRRWRIRRTDWTAPPLRIAVISDLHVGEPYVGLRRVRQIVRRANAVDADLVLLLGDGRAPAAALGLALTALAAALVGADGVTGESHRLELELVLRLPRGSHGQRLPHVSVLSPVSSLPTCYQHFSIAVAGTALC